MKIHPDRNRRMAGLVAALLLAILPLPASAQGDVEMITDGPVSAEALAGKLFPEPKHKTRAIVIGDEPVIPHVVGMVIQFEFDSAEIKSESQPYLDEVGRMMNLEKVSGKRLEIQGHTDATGSDEYNQRLSERRSLSVANYLVQNHGVDPAGQQIEPRRPRPGQLVAPAAAVSFSALAIASGVTPGAKWVT